jgi:3-oxoadipate enol-lactonase
MVSGELAHMVEGDREAEPLLLAASLGTTSAMWDSQAQSLGGRFRVVRYDHRGHGGSPAPSGPYRLDELAHDVLALLDRLQIQRASFCGVSLGGMVGLWLAAHAPARIRRLVVVCSSAHMPPAASWSQRAAAVRDAGSTEPIADAVVGRWLTPAYAEAHPEVVQRLRAMLVSTSAEGYASCCEAIEEMDLRTRLGGIRAPTLVIGGNLDRAAPPGQHAQVIVDGVPGSRLELVPAAHLASVELPQRVTDLIVDHLDQEDQP